MTAKLIGYVFEVEADDTRDLDKQRDNLLAIAGVESIDYVQGWFGDQSTWLIEWRPTEGYADINLICKTIDKAVKTRKVKKGHISNVFSEWVSAHDEYITKKAAQHPMGFYLTHVDGNGNRIAPPTTSDTTGGAA